MDKFLSAALLVLSMRMLRKETRKMQAPEFFWRERLMKLHSVLFIAYLIVFTLARAVETVAIVKLNEESYS